MKITQFILAAFVASPAWAHPDFLYSLSVEIQGRNVPLKGVFLGQEFQNASMLVHGDPSARPIKVRVKDGKLFDIEIAGDHGVGFDDGILVHGPEVTPMNVQKGMFGKVLHGPYYSCPLKNSTVRGIVWGPRGKGSKICFEVDLYLDMYMWEFPF